MHVNQSAIFYIITKAITSLPNIPDSFFKGTGKTGKTFLYRVLCSSNSSRDDNQHHGIEIKSCIVCVASTRISGLLLPSG